MNCGAISCGWGSAVWGSGASRCVEATGTSAAHPDGRWYLAAPYGSASRGVWAVSYAIELFDRFYLFSGVFRWLHILVGIVWIGILYYFNLVQVPAFAAFGDNAAARNLALDQVARRALWWFRWAALVDLRLRPAHHRPGGLLSNDFFKRATGLSILIGMILGIDHVPERVGRDLAQAEGRAGQRPRRAERPGRRPGRGRRGPAGPPGLPPELHLLGAHAVVHGRHRALLHERRLRQSTSAAARWRRGSSSASSSSPSSS